MKRLALSAALFLLATVVALVGPPAKAAAVSTTSNAVIVGVWGSPLGNLTASPLALTPAFDPTITDYVLRCQSGTNTVQVTLAAVPGGTIRVGSAHGASIAIQESLVENQALIIRANQVRTGSRVAYWIRCLPHDFPLLSVTKLGQVPAGWYLTGNLNHVAGSGTYAMVLDRNGTPVWYRKPAGDGAINVTLLPDRTIAWKSNVGPGFEDYDMKTQTTRWLVAPIPPTDLHELHVLPDGGLMMLSYPLLPNFDLSAIGLSSSATIVDCVVEEMDAQGGLVWQWRASDHISATESLQPSQTNQNGVVVYDIFHCNSVDTDSVARHVLLSSRHTDAIYLIDRATGTIIWKLGGNSPNHDNARILTIVNDPQGVFHAQHDARFQPNGDVSLYDNQTWDQSLAARGIEYHVDTTLRTATLVWSFLAPDGHNSAATGSFRRLNNGADNVICWGFKPTALFTEVDGADTVLLNVDFPTGESAYRVSKVAPSALDHQLLRATAGLP